MGSGAFTRPQPSTTMAGSTTSTSTEIITPQPSRIDRGKAIVTQSEVEPTPVIHNIYNHLTEGRKRRLAESLLVIIPGAFEGDDPVTAQEFAPTLRKIEVMLNKALRHGHYFGVKPWNSFPPALSPGVEFDFGLNPRSILFPMFTPNQSIEKASEPYDNMLLLWYALNAQGAKTTFSLFRILVIKEVKSEDKFLDMITNFKITVTRSDCKEYFFTLADLPFMNPADFATLIKLCSKRGDLPQMNWLITYFSVFLEFLFKDYAHQDVELGKRMKIAVKEPKDEYIDRDARINGEIIKDGDRVCGVYYELVGENGRKDRRMLRLENVGLYESSRITEISSYVITCPKQQGKRTEKFVMDRLTWIIDWRARWIEFSNEIFSSVYTEVEAIEREEQERLRGASGSGAANEDFVYRGD